MLPSILLSSPFKKGFVRSFKRSDGTVVQSHFTKRQPRTVKEKHLKERFYDHDSKSAKKAHDELEEKKEKHESLLEAVKKHHDQLSKKGPSEEKEKIPHETKLSHLKAEIKNQETNIENHSRKQDHIKNRREIDRKNIVRRKTKADLEKRISGHTDEQKKTIRSIHKSHQEGKSKLELGRVLKGKDKDHVYLETKHKDTGKTHHVAIHKDGSIKDPQIIYGGKFDTKDLKEHAKPKKVIVKKPIEKAPAEKEKSLSQLFKDYYSVETREEKTAINKLAKEKFMSDNPDASMSDYLKAAKKAKPDEGPEKIEAEEHKNRSEAMMGNKNAFKGGPKEEQKKLRPGKGVEVKTIPKEEPKKTIVKKIDKITETEDKALDTWISEEGNRKIIDLFKSGKTNKLSNDFENAVKKLPDYSGMVYRGLSNLDKETFDKIINSEKMDIPYYASASTKKEIADSFMRSKMEQGEESYGIIFKIDSKTGKKVDTYEGEIVLQPNSNYKIKKVGDIKPYTYKTRLLSGKTSKRTDKKRKIVEIEVEEIAKIDKTEAEKTKTRSEAMKGNKNAFKGGPEKEIKKEPEKPKVAAFTAKKAKPTKEQEKARTGKEALVITARSKDKHKVRYKVIEADDERLIASNHIDGRINKDYPKLDVKGALQMRDRSNIQSKSQVGQMANALEPMFLTDSKIASDGAPIVGGDYTGKEGHSVVESGNGRVMAIRTAYEHGKADHYKKHLVEEAEGFGIDPATIKGMKNPILIRERVEKMNDAEKAKFAKESNKATISQMTAVEQASEDSNYLGELTNLKASEGGRITHKNNKEFIKDFFSQVMDNDPREVGKLLNQSGQLNDEGERRITNAVFTRVYGAHSDIMNKLIMKDTDQTKKITAGMLSAAPRMAKFKTTLEKQDRHDLDIAGNFIDALTAMEELKRSGVSLEEKLQTIDWSELGVEEEYKDPLKNKDIVDIVKLIQEHGTGLTGSAKKISSLLTNYADEAEKAMFEEDPDRLTIEDAMGVSRDEQVNVTKKQIIKQAKDEVSFMQAEKKGKKDDYQSYLDEYPSGKFASQAKEKVEELSKPEEPGKEQASF